MRYNAPSIKGDQTFPQFFSKRKGARQCGHIDVTAHFKKWEELGMKMGKMYEAKVLVEAGGGSGSFDVTYFKMTDKAHPLPSSEPESSSSEVAKSSGSVARSSGSFGRSSGSFGRSSASVNPGSSGGTYALVNDLDYVQPSGTFQVFDPQGRYLGKLEVLPGTSVTTALKASFPKAQVYLVKQGQWLRRITVTR